MSRTDKTRPHWVKVNDHGYEHHEHDLFGLEVYRTRPIKDEDGNFVYEVAPTYVRAESYLRHRHITALNRTRPYWEREFISSVNQLTEAGRMIFTAYDESYLHGERPTNEVIAEAEHAVKVGDKRRLIEYGRYRRRKMERYLAYTVADHCTIDEPANMYGRYVNCNPCYKEADWYGDINVYRCNCSMCRGSDPSYERSRRRNNRDQMRKVTKLANSGEEDWEDGWNDLKVTTPIRYNSEWC